MKLFCPSCGSPVEFRYDDSFVRVCASCRSAIVRTDRGIDSFGQVADLTPTRSGLALGDRGRFRGQGFELVGRAQYRHPAGGSWEEWYLHLDDGRWAWLSEAQGAWVVTFPRPAPAELPVWGELRPEMSLAIGEPATTLVVGECNTSTLAAAEGEIPFQFTPGEMSRFADLSDGTGRFATLDYGPPDTHEAPDFYLGRRTSLAELELAPSALSDAEDREIGGQRLACPNCAGSIELRIPDRSLCVACPYCGSLLDCEGPLSILALQKRSEADAQPFPLGCVAEFDGVRFVVTGRLQRRVGTVFSWDEWLLYERSAGYRWLVRARGHYSFVTPLAAGSVRDGHDGVYYRNEHFQLYDQSEPQVTGVWGEFYWKVSVGETVEARDFIAPPVMLSCERSENEVHWSLGLYKTPAEIQRAFDLKTAPGPGFGVAGNQPFKHAWLARVTLMLGAALVLGTLLRLMFADELRSFSGRFELGASITPSEPAPGGNPTYVMFTPEFDLRANENTRVSLTLPVNNSWAYATVDLIHEASGELRTFAKEISYYHGRDGGDAWSEGEQRASEVLPAGRSGKHVLRIELQTPAPVRLPLDVQVEQDVFPWSHFVLALVSLAVPAALFALYQWSFERERWSESDHAPALYAVGYQDD